MNYNVEATDFFKRQVKRLVKKFPSLKSEFKELVQSLEENPKQGTPIGKNCYKIRLAIASKGKGKSGGARIITHVYIVRKIVYLLSIYDKSEQEDISPDILEILLRHL
ncbi:MAG: type II toxin-antitoxin system RelE/ParE family toxin [Chitinophagaceae bacterium]|nr:type II toxin-antitoxin system RelE/ParE family toxin [Chitinophagaceae bacterium]